MPEERIIIDPDLLDDLGPQSRGRSSTGGRFVDEEASIHPAQIMIPALPAWTTSPCDFKTLGLSLRDPEVDRIQRLINARQPQAAPLLIDSYFGPVTENALKQCQRAEHLPVTGVMDRATWYGLLKGEVSQNKKQLQPPELNATNAPVWRLTLEEKFEKTLYLALPKLPLELDRAIKEMMTPAALAMIAGVMVLWAGSHLFGVGVVVDIILLVSGMVFLGFEIWQVADDFGAYLSKTAAAETEKQLDEAAAHLARIITVLGVEVFLAVVAKAGGRLAGKARKEAEAPSKPQDRKTDGLDEVEGAKVGNETVVADNASHQELSDTGKTVDELIDSDLDWSNSLNGLEGENFKNNALMDYHINPYVADLTRDEYLSLHVYTTNLYDPINKGLRGLSPSDKEKWSKVAADADAALVKLAEIPETRYEGNTFRGDSFSDELLDELFPVGGVHQDMGFKSSSYDSSGAFPGNTTTSIVSKSGVKVDDISVKQEELEVLFRPGTKFKVLSRETIDGHNYVDLEEL